MRIGVVSMIHEPWGGSEELWAAMAKKALKQGHEVYHSTLVVDALPPKITELLNEGLKQIKRRGLVPPRTKIFLRVLIKGLNYVMSNFISNPFNAFFSNKPDIVIYNGTCYSIAEDKLLVNKIKRTGTRFFIIAHFSSDNHRLLTEADCNTIREAYSTAEKVFFVSKRNLQTARRHLYSTIENAAILRNPVNLPLVDLIPFPENDILQFAMVGNLVTMHKGQDMVLEILKNNNWQNRNWHLNIYGTGMDDQYLKKLCEFYGISPKVSFHGKVNDMRKVWSDNNILLMPSTMEGMPLAVVEAMLCGRPSVVTDVGGHTEWIENDKEGFVAEASSVQSIEKAMEQAWMNKHKWKEMGIAAHHKAMQLYDADAGQTLLTCLLNK